ncbi:uncharacterized protein TNCV_951481 [Trichonephila clavipes]|nr:uncharacterized protein TNCV_951481 [Trichonephila clavipes]
MNLNILAFVFKNEVHCKMCNSGLDMQVLKGKSGLAITFVLKCFACPYSVEFSSSNFHEGTQIATINTRFVYAMRSIGKDAEAGRMFCGIMNLPQPPTRFSPYGKRILNAAKLVYEDSIQNAAMEAICKNEGNKNIAVAVDGTWQKRGYTSLNGIVTVTSIETVACFVTGSSPVPLKTRRVGQRCTLNLSRAETSSRWCGVGVERGCQLRCRPRHLTMVQNYVVRRQSPRVAEQCDVNIQSINVTSIDTGEVIDVDILSKYLYL